MDLLLALTLRWQCAGNGLGNDTPNLGSYFATAVSLAFLPNVGLHSVTTTVMDPDSRTQFQNLSISYFAPKITNECPKSFRDHDYPAGEVKWVNVSLGSNFFIGGISEVYGGTAIDNLSADVLAPVAQGVGVSFVHNSLVFPASKGGPIVSSTSEGRILPYNWSVSSWNHTLQRLVTDQSFSLVSLRQVVFPVGFPSILTLQLPYLESVVNVTRLLELLSMDPQSLKENNLQTFLLGIVAGLNSVLSNPFPLYLGGSTSCGETMSSDFVLANFLNASANLVKGAIKTFGSDPSLLPAMVPLAFVHMGIQRELFVNGTTLYGLWRYCCSGQCDNANPSQTYFEPLMTEPDPQWLRSLVQTLSFYLSYFDLMVPQWRVWRYGLIWGTFNNSGWMVRDNLTGVTVQGTLQETGDCMECFMNGTILAMQNEANAYLMDVLEPVNLLHLFVPGLSSAKGHVLAQYANTSVQLGPYAPANPPALAGYNGNIYWDGPGKVIYVHGLSGELISQLQFVYENHDGNLLGLPSGNPFKFSIVNDTWITSFQGSFAYSAQYAGVYAVLSSLQVSISNGTFSQRYGDFEAAIFNSFFNATVGKSYALVETGQGFVPQQSGNPNNTNLLGLLAFNFYPVGEAPLSPAPRIIESECQAFLQQCGSGYHQCCNGLSCRRHTCSSACSNCTGQKEDFLCVASSRSPVPTTDATSTPTFLIVWNASCSYFNISIENTGSFSIGVAGLWVQSQSSLQALESGCIVNTALEQDCVIEAIPSQQTIIRSFSTSSASNVIVAQIAVFTNTSLTPVVVSTTPSTCPYYSTTTPTSPPPTAMPCTTSPDNCPPQMLCVSVVGGSDSCANEPICGATYGNCPPGAVCQIIQNSTYGCYGTK